MGRRGPEAESSGGQGETLMARRLIMGTLELYREIRSLEESHERLRA